MDPQTLLNTWKREEQQPFSGWNFSYLDQRFFEDEPPWNYLALATSRMKTATSVLDMGTGGGERFLQLRPYWPGKVVATEDYPPNVILATERLTSYGVKVYDVELTDTGSMPFIDGEFDLVLNRHSSFNCNEVARILAPGGTFLTQQIHGLWGQDLIEAFGAKPQWPDSTPEKYEPLLERAGLEIVNSQEWKGRFWFTDVGAVVYYLKAIPWMVPGFSVDTHLASLMALQDRLEQGRKLEFLAWKYLIEAHKPGAQ